MRRLVFLSLAALSAVPFLVANAAIPETSAVLAGAGYIKSIQSPDGGYGTTAFGQHVDAIFAVRAAGYDPAKDLAGTSSAASFFTAHVGEATTTAAAAKAALGATALGLDPRAVGGKDLVATVNAGYNSGTGAYAEDDFSQSIAMLGLACTGNSVPSAAVGALKKTQLTPSGGWGFGGFADPDTTAIAVQALLASGTPKTDKAVTDALAYLKASQGDDGGWGFDPTASNASSTAYVVQALIALGENSDVAAWEKSGKSPVEFLLSQQQADGSFLGFDPAYATNQAVPALAGRTFCDAPKTPITRTRPVVGPSPSPSPAPTTTATVVPAPPATGTGTGSGGDTQLPVFVAAGLVLLAASGGMAMAARRRG